MQISILNYCFNLEKFEKSDSALLAKKLKAENTFETFPETFLWKRQNQSFWPFYAQGNQEEQSLQSGVLLPFRL